MKGRDELGRHEEEECKKRGRGDFQDDRQGYIMGGQKMGEM